MAMHKKLFLAAVAFVSFALAPAHSEESPRDTPDEQFIRKSVEEYCDAFNKGDVDAVLAFWADDADYADADGQIYRGKEAIRPLLSAAAENLEGYKLVLKIDALRLVKPEAAIEDGVAVLTGPDGDASNDHYTAIWTKDGDHWVISSARDLPATDTQNSTNNANSLDSLAWLVGDWTSDDDGRTVNLTVQWALDKNFLVQEYVVAGEAGDDLHVMQWVGLDPASGQVRSWAFDSRGGRCDGAWTRDDDRWVSESTGVLPDGRAGSELNTIRFIDDSHLEWSSTGRNVDGQAMPDLQVRFVRNNQPAEDSNQ